MIRSLIRCRSMLTVACASLLLAAGCTTLVPHLQSPKLSLVSIQLQQASVFEQRMLVRLRVNNPNDLALPVRGIDVRFDLEGEPFAKGVSAREFEVPALGEAEFDMLVTADAAAAMTRLLTRGRSRATEPLHYRIQGTLKTRLGVLRSVPFDERGTVPLEKLLRDRKGTDQARAARQEPTPAPDAAPGRFVDGPQPTGTASACA